MPLKLWDTATGREIGSFNRYSFIIAFFADGKTLVTQKSQVGSHGTDLELWDPVTGREKVVLHTSPGEEIVTVAVAPDGKSLAAGTSLLVRSWSWDGAGWRENAHLNGFGWGVIVAFSPDSQTLVVGGEQLKSYEVGSGKERVWFKGHVGTIRALAFSPDGKSLSSGGDDRTVRTWEAATGKELACRPHAGLVRSLAASPDGKTLAAGCSDTTITLWEMAPANPDVVLSQGGVIDGLAFTPDGQGLVSSGGVHNKHWDVGTGRLRYAQPLEWTKSMQGLMKNISPEGRTQAFQGPAGTLTLCDLATGRPGPVLNGHSAPILAVAFSPVGGTVATGSSDGTAMIWDGATGRPRLTVIPKRAGSVTSGQVSAVAFSPDGTLLATGTQYQIVTLWDVATGRERLTLQDMERVGTGSHIWSLAFSPDGKTLAVASDQGTVRLWDVTSGASRGALQGHTDSIRCLTFSPDGNTLATGSADKTAKLWDVATGQERLTLNGHTGPVLVLAFAPDGNTLATGSGDATVRLWRAPRDPAATARSDEADPDDPDTAQALNTAGERLWSIGRREESEEAFHKAMARASRLMESFPDDPGYRQELVRSRLGLGLLLSTGGRSREAAQARREATTLLQDLTPRTRPALAYHFCVLADQLQAAGHATEADESSRLSVEIEPDNPLLWLRRSILDTKLGHLEAFDADFLRVIAMSRKDARSNFSALITNGRARLLVTRPDARLRDPKLAVELARMAVRLAPGEGAPWNTLGLAYYRTGEWKLAIEALTKSMELGKGGDANDWFFLAMACWQLGDKPGARSWYDKADQSMRKNQPANEELARFGAEAAALLEVKAKGK